jgi:hypothetical protein
MDLICVKDPNQDYRDWIFRNTGLEVDELPIKFGKIYSTKNLEQGNKLCWGQIQEYTFLIGYTELGPIPSKYFETVDNIRLAKICQILSD